MGTVSEFMEKHFQHFNAATLLDAAVEYKKHVECGGKMMVTLAGAMSTAKLGISLAEMIRQDKIHAITCTGANLEEDLYLLVSGGEYRDARQYRQFTDIDEVGIFEMGLSRITDVLVPETGMCKVDDELFKLWKKAHDEMANPKLPHEYFYDVIRSGVLKDKYQMPVEDSWLVAACEKNLPIFVPGWEDSTEGNSFASSVILGDFTTKILKTGIDYMQALYEWYISQKDVGFFQIGGGIAGDFPICVVPMVNIDLKKDAPMWQYFCQISDSTTSYGSYSGAVPNEKITWGKLDAGTPRFIVESDATIVAPLIFEYVLGR